MLTAYYNEFDPKAAAWLRELIDQELLPAGDVDERSIEDVPPAELLGYTQCHFFAGIGGWSLALRIAGWPDDRPVWTGSCPCQPFSQAGARTGTDDERHLWPHFRWLIDQCRPVTVFGEQVASKDGRQWFAGVRADLDLLGYATGATDLCAASVGAPHIRQRIFWVGHTNKPGTWGYTRTISGTETQSSGEGREDGRQHHSAIDAGSDARLGDSNGESGGKSGELTTEAQEGRSPKKRQAGLSSDDVRLPDAGRILGSEGRSTGPSEAQSGRPPSGAARRSQYLGISDTSSGNAGAEREQRSGEHGLQPENDGDRIGLDESDRQRRDGERIRLQSRGSFEAGLEAPWSGASLIGSTEGKTRRIEPSIEPLAHGLPARLVRLRGYGNAIVPQLAQEFIKAFLEDQADGEQYKGLHEMPGEKIS